MSRSTAVTVCVVGGDDRRATRQFLDRLAPSLGTHDNVVVFSPGRSPVSEVGAWRILSGRGELRPATGAAPPRLRPAVVLIEDRVEVVDGWIDLLVGALEVDGIGAVAPRTNVADGDELYVGVPYRPHEHGLRRSFMRDLAATHEKDFTDAKALAGPCVALRRDSLDLLGGLDAVLGSGFDPAKFVASIAASGKRVVVAEGCYVHHPGGTSRRPDPREAGLPLISACLIVKDEQENLPRCLEAIAPFVDEIIVYDTGSSDATIAIAEQAGATVVRGYWDDDFGRARNDALEYCNGQWIAWVDADEALVCDDPVGVRSALASLTTEIEAYVILIENFSGNEAASTFTHPACRLFRRAYAHWQGHLHELVLARVRSRELARRLYEDVRILHRGYLQSYMAGRSKGQRNLRTAFGDLAGGSELDWATRLMSLGRSYAVVGQLPEAVEHLSAAAAQAQEAGTERLARRTAVECLLGLGRTEEALEQVNSIRATPGGEMLSNLLEGRVRQALGEHEAALECFDKLREVTDNDGFEYSPGMVSVPRGELLRALGRDSEAADALLSSLEVSGQIDAHLGMLLESLELAGRGPGEIYDAIGKERIEPFVPQLLQLQPAVADRILEAWCEREPGSRHLLAAAALVAKRLDVGRQLIWSSRLRQAGLPGACPLVAAAADESVAVRDRVLSAAAATAMFPDVRARQVFSAAVLSAPASTRGELEEEVAAIAGGRPELFNALRPPQERTPTEPPAPTAPRVLIVDRELASMRTAAVAAVAARTGYAVTLVQPLPALSSSALLAPLGIVVRGWHPSGPEVSSWRSSCERVLAWQTAESPVDIVVVTLSAIEVLPAIRRLLPLALIVLDIDDAQVTAAELPEADLLLTSSAKLLPSSYPVARLTASAQDVLLEVPVVPLSARNGLCVVGNAQCAPRAAIDYFVNEVAPLLTAACKGASIALCGDDPDRILPKALPTAIAAGALADPTPWIASAKSVLVTHVEGAAHWLAVAERCGTPALVVGASPESAGELAVRVEAAMNEDAVWMHHALNTPHTPTHGEADPDPFAALLRQRDPRRRRRSSQGKRPEVRIVGGAYGLESLAQVNRELAVHLVAEPRTFNVSMLTREAQPYPEDSVRALSAVRVLHGSEAGAVDLEIRHQWPPDFRSPRRGLLVCMQPWEFGGLPAEWLAPLRDVVDELWVPTSWVRECAVRSGVEPSKVHVVPNGVDVERFRPEGSRYPLKTTKSRKLLFVGGLIERKGIDALIEAYLSAFSREDDVCLVVKPFGSQSVYRGSTLEREVRQAATSDGPEIELIEGDLGFDEMASLYRSCDALVHPYRGEGFGMPIAEAMASGLPVVVPNGGACLDFCNDDNAWLVPAREVPIGTSEWTPSAPGAWWLEPSRTGLAAALRAAVDESALGKTKGAAGRSRIVEGFTWAAVADRAAERIEALIESPAEQGLDGPRSGRSSDLART